MVYRSGENASEVPEGMPVQERSIDAVWDSYTERLRIAVTRHMDFKHDSLERELKTVHVQRARLEKDFENSVAARRHLEQESFKYKKATFVLAPVLSVAMAALVYVCFERNFYQNLYCETPAALEQHCS